MRLLVCGGRRFWYRSRVWKELDLIHAKTPVSCLIHGHAMGADALAAEWAEERRVDCITGFVANWKRFGRAAGPMRNAKMLSEGKPDLVVAFPGGVGTADMVKKAKAAGVTVKEIR